MGTFRMEGAEAGIIEEQSFEIGRVNRVCRQWLVHEDGVVAQKLQEKENEHHFGYNRENRQTVREDILEAKIAQHQEELREQEEAMRSLEEKNRQAAEDEKLAKAMLEDLERMEREERENRDLLANHDQEYAKQLQEKEQRRYERYLEKKKERDLARDRKRLERHLARQHDEIQGRVQPNAGDDGSLASGGTDSAVRNEDGKLEDVGDFSDFYMATPPGLDEVQQRMLREQQDEELAKLLQEQEHKRGAHVGKEKYRDLEMKDAELARIIQEQEKIKLKKLQSRMKNMSVEEKQHSSHRHHHPPPERSLSTPESHHSGEPLYHELHLESPRERHYSGSRVSSSDQTINPYMVSRIPPPLAYVDDQILPRTPSPPPRGIESQTARSRLVEADGRNNKNTRGGSPARIVAEFENYRAPTPEEPIDESAAHITSGPEPTFNIAAAIDPTFKRRVQGQQTLGQDRVTDQYTINNRPGSGGIEQNLEIGEDDTFGFYDEDIVAVQGQHRNIDRKRSGDKRGSCKQQ